MKRIKECFDQSVRYFIYHAFSLCCCIVCMTLFDIALTLNHPTLAFTDAYFGSVIINSIWDAEDKLSKL